MNTYENLDKIYDAVVDWDEFFALDLEPGLDHSSAEFTDKNPSLLKEQDVGNVVYHGGRAYYVNEIGHLWPI